MATSLNQSLVDDIVQRIVQVAKPERIILFGSQTPPRREREWVGSDHPALKQQGPEAAAQLPAHR
jgi:hypothetical protein